MKTILLMVTLMSTTMLAVAAEQEKLKIFSADDKKLTYQVGEGDSAIQISRVMTACAKNKGWLQDLIPAPGVHPVTEIEMLKSLNDPDALVIDMRMVDHYLEGTIPTAKNIPYTEVALRMDELGCEKQGEQWNCAQAKKVYGFCNGAVCPQSSIAMKAMIRDGFPANKLYYYRGGMLVWEALGLTTVAGEF